MVSTILKDGNTLYTDAEAFAAGTEVYFMNGEEKVSVDAGEYEAEDGTIIVIGEGSVISEIKEVEPAEPEMPETETEQASTTITLDAIKEYLDPILQSIQSILEELKSAGIKQSVEQMEIKLEKIISDNEIKSTKPVDLPKASEKKPKLDYDIIKKYQKKF